MEKKLQPILNRQRKLDIDVLNVFANRIKVIKSETPIDSQQRTIRDLKNIDNYIYDTIAIQLMMIEDILTQIAMADYRELMQRYDLPEYKNNISVKNSVENVIETSKQQYTKLMDSPCMVMRDLRNPQTKKPQSVNQAYTSVINEAKQALKSNLDFEVAMNRTFNQLVDSGLRVAGDNYNLRIDVGLNQQLLNDAKDVRQTVQTETGKQYQSDAVEISVHAFPAPDHAPVQGHQFSLEEFAKLQNGENFTDLNGTFFLGFERAIGEWNCRHFTFSIKTGDKPAYSEEELNLILENNEQGATMPNGKHYTLYQATQKQKQYERDIRELQQGIEFAKNAELDKFKDTLTAKMSKKKREYIQFSNTAGLAHENFK